MYKDLLKKWTRGKTLFSTEICYIRRKSNEIDLNKDQLFYQFLKNNEIIKEFEPKLEEPILTGNGLKDPDNAIKFSNADVKKTSSELNEILKIMNI